MKATGQIQRVESGQNQQMMIKNLKSVGGNTIKRLKHPPDQSESIDLDEMLNKQRQYSDPSQLTMKRGVTQFTNFEQGRDSRIDNLQMYTDIFDLEDLQMSDNFVVKTYKESFYAGEIDPDTNQRSGLGIIQYDNNRHYEGNWQEDKRHGRGFERFTNQNTYYGQYKKGKVCGKGVYKWVEGDTYDGEWLNGQKHGYGNWSNQAGDSFIGGWEFNMAHGIGVHEWENGDRYEGNWKHSLRHGDGTDRFANGDQYQGEYKYGTAEGNGVYKWTDGNTYTGYFKNGQKQGAGVWKKSGDNDNQYLGEYLDDMKHGPGEFKWGTGGHYKGSYAKDHKEGYGEMKWADGSVYKGHWEKGIQNGLGMMEFSNGIKRAGTFKDNVLCDLLTQKEAIEVYEQLHNKLPQDFKKELRQLIQEQNYELEEMYLQTELKANYYEEVTPPNNLIYMQDPSNAPWGKEGGMSKQQFVQKVKIRDRGTQNDGPPQSRGTQMSDQYQHMMLEDQDPQRRREPVYLARQENQQRKLRPQELNRSAMEEQPYQRRESTPRLIFHDFDYVVASDKSSQNKQMVKWNKQTQQQTQKIIQPHLEQRRNSNNLPDISKRGPNNIFTNSPATDTRNKFGTSDLSKNLQRNPQFISKPSVQNSTRQKFQMPAIGGRNSDLQKKQLKTLMQGRAWIPGGHANSLGRNKLSSYQYSYN